MVPALLDVEVTDNVYEPAALNVTVGACAVAELITTFDDGETDQEWVTSVAVPVGFAV